MNYFWIRIFDYDPERDGYEKGMLLDEFYLNDANGRETAKRIVCDRYSQTSIAFAKPKKKPGVYAIVMESSQFYFDRFYTMVDSRCFWCLESIQGHAKDFPNVQHEKQTVYFCKYECKRKYYNAIDPMSEGEFQEKEEGESGDVFGYIYLIYNRILNQHYIGQTRYMPFFRWQEHVKDGAKGNISDLVFSVLTEVRRNRKVSDDVNQQYLNSMEAWWIHKYAEEGHNVSNITKPRITIEHLKQRFNEMVAKTSQTNLRIE